MQIDSPADQATLNRHPGIKARAPGIEFETICCVRKLQLLYTRHATPYLSVELSDYTGRLKGKIWERPVDIQARLSEGCIVKLRAAVQFVYGHKELKIFAINRLESDTVIPFEQLIGQSRYSREELVTSFRSHVNLIQDSDLRSLISAIVDRPGFFERYSRLPAGKLWHHNYVGGLLEHINAMCEVANAIYRHHTEINLDYLLAGIICHPVGMVRFHKWCGFLDYSDEGRLLSYVSISAEMIQQTISEIRTFPTEKKTALLHMVYSHLHGIEGTLSLPPMTLEAIALNILARLDTHLNAAGRILRDDISPGTNWTKFSPLLKRKLYINRGPDVTE